MMPGGSLRVILKGGLLALAILSSSTGFALADNICTLLTDGRGNILSSQGDCDRAVPPASTFKIPLSLMGYDSGFLKDEHTPKRPFEKGYPDWIKAWRTDIDPASWMRESVLWYSQRITEDLGMERFRRYVEAFDYGNADVSGDAGKNNGLTRSWLSSSLRITPAGQIGFLRKMVYGELPVSARAHDMTRAILTRHDLPGGWTVLGKTGSGFSVRKNGTVDRNRPFGWYVGWATKDDRIVFFARLIEHSSPQGLATGIATRADLLKRLPGMLAAL